jgi:hypothetical protein
MNRALLVAAALVAATLTVGSAPSSSGAPGGEATLAVHHATLSSTSPHGCASACRATANTGFKSYIACSLKTSAKPARKCDLSGPKAAFFRSAKHDVDYKVCVKLVEKGHRPLCASGIEAPKGKTTFISLALSTAGTYTATWTVAGKVVGSRAFEIIDDLQ